MRSASHNVLTLSDAIPGVDVQRVALDQESFHELISLERKRTERSGSPFALMLIDIAGAIIARLSPQLLDKVLSVLLEVSRETDAIGWYETDSVIGVMFTELSPEDKRSLVDV